MALHKDLPIYAVTRDLSKLITQVVSNMQKDYKFTLGKRLDDLGFDLAMDVFRANESREGRPDLLRQMREKVVAIELAMRFAVDLRRMPEKQYAQAIQLTDSIGKQITGWLRKSETRQQPSCQGSRASAHR